MRTKNDASQLEFDWLALALMDGQRPLPREVLSLAKSAGLPQPESEEVYYRLEGLAVRLHHMNLKYDDRGFSLAEELETVRVLVGPTDWRSKKNLWTRRAQRDPSRIRIFILLMKHKLGLS